MSSNTTVGIDIGTYQIKVMVAQMVKGKTGAHPTVIGTGFAESKGLRHGYIINENEVVRGLETAIEEGKMKRLDILNDFYIPFAAELKKAADPEAKQAKAKQASLELAWTISKVG